MSADSYESGRVVDSNAEVGPENIAISSGSLSLKKICQAGRVNRTNLSLDPDPEGGPPQLERHSVLNRSCFRLQSEKF
jgi:hypothetical protein